MFHSYATMHRSNKLMPLDDEPGLWDRLKRLVVAPEAERCASQCQYGEENYNVW